MSAVRRLPVITSILAVGFSLTAVSASPSARRQIAKTLGLSAPGGIWRFVAVLFALLNLKNLPLAWHYRLFRGLIYQLYLQPTELPKDALFLPLITTSYTSLLETDYNFHKSNSTYYTDLDIARVHLVSAILKKGIRGIGKHPENKNATWSFANTSRAAGSPHVDSDAQPDPGPKQESSSSSPKPLRTVATMNISPFGTSAVESGLTTPARSPTPNPTQPLTPPSAGAAAAGQPGPSAPLTEEQWWHEAKKPGNLLLALGGNSCHFHREIAPYARFEIWTRLLSWDRKWLYFVSHFVEAGAFRPQRYILQPKRNPSRSRSGDVAVVNAPSAWPWERMTEEQRARAKRKIFATSISKYVVKKGRLTIPPELVLQRSEMLPERPPGLPGTFGTGAGAKAAEDRRSESPDKGLDVLEESLFAGEAEGAWTWERVEAERQRGLKLCQMFDGLDGLREMFDMGEQGVMGRYTDWVGGV